MPSGIVIWLRLSQFENANAPMLVTLSEIVTLLKLLQFMNAYAPMFVTLSGIVTLLKLLQSVNPYAPMPVILSGRITPLRLSQSEKAEAAITFVAVYAYLLRCENRKTFQCHPSYKTIGKAVGMSKNTVKKYVDSLIKKRLITVEPTSVITQKGERRNGNLCYTIRPIGEALEQYYEQQLIRLHEETRRQAALKKLAEFDRKHEKSAV